MAQANAGVVALIVPSRENARAFLEKASAELLATYPGLPFFAAVVPFELSDDKEGREAYSQARKKADDEIGAQRNQQPVPQGSGLLPILIPARLDGLPAMKITMEKDTQRRCSLPSLARSAPALIEASRKRLQRQVAAPAGKTLIWHDDLEKLVGGEGGKVALICIDGNDLGKLFGARLRESGDASLSESIASMRALSELVRTAEEKAFAKACELLAEWLSAASGKSDTLNMPVRPLVMGGDDLTIIAKGEIALAFILAFSAAFENIGKKEGLSVGIGMVAMDSSYPFAKAFPLAESLQDSAKKLTAHLHKKDRPSSLDYLVLTEDVENSIAQVRQRLFTSASGEILTGKPFTVSQKPALPEFTALKSTIANGLEVNNRLARSQMREAWILCRKGSAATKSHYENLRENVSRKLGGRGENLMPLADFDRIFPKGYFHNPGNGKKSATLIGDYLELERLLPQDPEKRKLLLELMEGVSHV